LSKDGKIDIPKPLVAALGLCAGMKVIFVGALDHLEI
jgi:DNA-binding transcriptional regulator/RsmH inhibitor MraZ